MTMLVNLEQDRARATMLLFAFERGLANVMRSSAARTEDIDTNLVAVLQGRARNKGLDPNDLSSLVEAAYLHELLELIAACDKLPDRVRSSAHQIAKFFAATELHDVRCAVAHQNRVWRPHYYSLTETLCLMEATTSGLGLSEVADAYAAISAGTIDPPPGEWLERLQWSGIPSNVKQSAREELARNLLGRREELQKLHKHLLSPRCNSISVVGPGGIGKTAFVAHALNQLSMDSDAAKRFDRIVFLTGKSVRLTHLGPIATTPDFSSIDELRLSVAISLGADSFEECVRAFEELRLLLCIDNLEDLLKHRADALEDFQSELPVPWVLLATSRIAVPAHASISLSPLREVDLRQISDQRLTAGGVEKLRAHEIACAIAKEVKSPLAAVVACDAICFGAVSVEAALRSAGDLTVDFAFSALLETLDTQALSVLDAIWCSGNQADVDGIATVLSEKRPRVEEALATLRRANLVIAVYADDTDEVPKLVPAAHEYLDRRPASAEPQRREEIYRSWTRLQAIVRSIPDTVQVGLPVSETRHVPRLLLLQLNERVGRLRVIGQVGCAEIYREIQGFESEHGATANSAWLLYQTAAQMADHGSACAAHLARAFRLAPTNLQIRLRFGMLKFQEGDLVSAAEILEPVVEEICRAEVRLSPRDASEAFSTFYKARVFALCDLAKQGVSVTAEHFKPILADLRRPTNSHTELNRRLCIITTLRRSVERGVTASQRCVALSEALEWIEKTFEERTGFISWWRNEIISLLEAFAWLFESWDFDDSSKLKMRLRRFIEAWGSQLVSEATSPTELAHTIKKLCGSDSKNQTTSAAPAVFKEDLEALGYREAVVYAPPNGRAYCFARDSAGTQFYISFRSFSSKAIHFDQIVKGTRLLVLPSPDQDGMSAVAARDVRGITE
jgi:hypothetical protein